MLFCLQFLKMNGNNIAIIQNEKELKFNFGVNYLLRKLKVSCAIEYCHIN